VTDTIPSKQEARRLGGGWFHSTELLEGEEVLREAEVLHKPSRSDQGGRLYLTDRRLIYLPDRWSAVLGDERVEWSLDAMDDVGMTRGDGGVIFRSGYLLVFECLFVRRGDERHLFSTRLPLTDREWVAAIKAARSGAMPPAPEGEESLSEVPHAPPGELPGEGQAHAQEDAGAPND
jgi:hypothetical protein